MATSPRVRATKLPDEVAKKEDGKVPQVCDSEADVEHATEAPQQQQQQLNTAAVREPDDAAHGTKQRTAEQVVAVPDDEELQQTEPVQQRSVEQAVEALSLDEEPLNVTQRVPSKSAPEGSTARAVRLELERVRFEKEARRKYLRARALSPHRASESRQ